MNGRRVYPNEKGEVWFKEGDYGRDPNDGEWKGRPPGCHLGSFADHEVVEHDDGTITVSPSILVTHPEPIGIVEWHGYLERGVWRVA